MAGICCCEAFIEAQLKHLQQAIRVGQLKCVGGLLLFVGHVDIPVGDAINPDQVSDVLDFVGNKILSEAEERAVKKGAVNVKTSLEHGDPATVILRYALKVAVLPTITLVGIGFGALLSGTVFAEIIFARPGIGKIIYDMVLARNFPVVQGAVLATIALYVVVTVISDLIVAALDPRVRDSL